MTKSTKKQRIDGMLLINKPKGLSSNGVLQRVRWLLNAKKAGHTGSLDPLATGMLPLCFGDATKFAQFGLLADKCYEVEAQLGITTDTGDAEGNVLTSVSAQHIDLAMIEAALPHFLGPIYQTPPMYSALKHQGQPLYHYARQGVDIEREARPVTIHQLTLLSFADHKVRFQVVCSKGTYIRTLMEDLGDHLGVGAHVTALHRVYSAGFETEPMMSLEDFEALSMNERLEALLPVDSALRHFPKLTLSQDDFIRLYQGKMVQLEAEAGCFRLYAEEGHFVGLVELDGVLKVKRMISDDAC